MTHVLYISQISTDIPCKCLACQLWLRHCEYVLFYFITKQDSDVIILPRTGSFKRWPALLKPLQSTFSLDAWEVALEDITIFENSVLGRGHFGEVNKGQLSGRGYKRGSIRGIRVPRFSLNCIVAIKRLQSKLLASQ